MASEATRLQERVVLGVEKSIVGGRNAMVDAPTGAGKSRTFSRIAENGVEKGEKVIILSHRKNLARQALRNVDRWAGSAITTSLSIGGDLDQSGQVVSSTIQTANQNLAAIGRYDRAIIDEGHHAVDGNSDYENIIKALKRENPGIALVTVSATFPDDRSRMLPEFQKADVHTITFEEAIEARLVDLPRTATPPEMMKNNKTIAEIVAEARGKSAGIDVEGIGAQIAKNLPDDWTQTQAWHYDRHFANTKTISFFDTVKEAEAFTKEVRSLGIEIEAIHSGRWKGENESALDRFENGGLMGLVSVDMVSEGFDVDARGLFLGKKTTSASEYRQIVGRGSRSYGEAKEGKTLLIDMGASTHLHGEIGAQAAANNLRKSIEGRSSAPELAPESEKARAIWKPINGTNAFAATIDDSVVYAVPVEHGYIAMRSVSDRKGHRLALLEIEGQRRGRPSRDAFLTWSTEAIRQSERKLARIMSGKGGVEGVIQQDWGRNETSVRKNIELLSSMPPPHLQAQMLQQQGMGR